ncbi:sulfoxide reductase heme-binding subunit YedZ [Aquabacterium olei]|uniref:Protein-methionine-sulfoxide reductase heme-binding subunit MsrQ n=1 Tax=Aquabacterium olei TaxID=1296669 RepID=A0A2U8FNJ6_9BURK|nr:protein-methionine-sulfoxide reductase heme-binding subunit MsrQ [Aquabacterium olei]AWI52418.1 sulfoxide reductase heme-binding subunit YedZ [Aquabacterium olei]
MSVMPAPALSFLNAWLVRPWMKPLLWAVCAVPAVALLIGAVVGSLGANPAEKLIRETGEWALRWLWLTLAITPLRELASLPALVRFRRTLGVTTFVYAVLHLLSYAGFDKGWVLDDIVRDVFKRNFILVGMLGFVVMLPLALTSFNAAVRALGGRRWQWLHRLTYVVAMLGLLHFYLKKAAKNDTDEVLVYAVILAVLFGWRVMRRGGILAMWRVR